MNLLHVASLEEARAGLLSCAEGRLLETETVDTPGALGRILAQDLLSPEDLPAFSRSLVDGYAVRAADTTGAGDALPVFLRLAGAVEMGRASDFSLVAGEGAVVPTGGMIPPGADAMVMTEFAEAFDSQTVAIYEAVSPGQGLLQAGEDIPAGDLLLPRGTRLGSREIGALAALGLTRVAVTRPIPLHLISTGDELLSPESTPGPGSIRDVNSWAISALAIQSGYALRSLRVIPDDEALLEEALREGMTAGGVVALSGSSSQGEKDVAARVIARLSRPGIFVHGLALKPGKPGILAFDEASGTILAGLPGHPLSAMMVFRALFTWLVQALTGLPEPLPLPARLACNLPSAPGRTTLQPVTIRREGEGYGAEPLFGKSGIIASLTRASGFILIDRNTEGLRAGDLVWVHLF